MRMRPKFLQGQVPQHRHLEIGVGPNQLGQFVLVGFGQDTQPAVIATARSRLGCAPVEEEQLVTLLIMNWKRLLDEVDPLDPQALPAYWRPAPVREHPLCYYLAGMIHTLTFVRGWWGRDVDREPARSPHPNEERSQRDGERLTGERTAASRTIITGG